MHPSYGKKHLVTPCFNNKWFRDSIYTSIVKKRAKLFQLGYLGYHEISAVYLLQLNIQ